ncbi:3-oxoacyl-ACP synthase III family protein [Parabacteroides sp. ZJ-118]|uniref:3-oxoacyl-ACP synthase III family protein n=1 Tax=Parabacteroides sp. ZJ-118 TaxID=2709398 RepID=UPI0013EDA3A7|nr:ketoacyl-ACP synthase III [Parabacteroides sp. ZJ-118]
MAYLDIKNIAIKGISACVPSASDRISDIYKWGGVDNFMESTGIKARRRSSDDVTTADLCCCAAEKLIADLGWNKNEIETLVFVTQTPDYKIPATSCILQHRLGLSKECHAIDISLGCSGWVYGISALAALLQNGTIKKGLLLVGDTPTKGCSPEDKSTWPLFGDAGAATALEYSVESNGMQFVFNTDGSGYETIIVREGGYRTPVTESSLKMKDCGDDIFRRGIDLELDGMDVFSFGITKAPKSVKRLCEHFCIDKDSIDIFSFHQANLMMNEMIRKKLRLPEEKVPYCMDEFANTSSASIPLALVTREREKLQTEKLKHVACGFGVGLSWGSVYFETDKIVVPELIEI